MEKGGVNHHENPSSYEMVIGLEVHVELKTQNQDFLRLHDRLWRAAQHPVLPGVHGHARHAAGAEQAGGALRGAGRAGHGLHIARYSKQDRKNYFYPDLPKAYQISPVRPAAVRGRPPDVEIVRSGEKRIGITRIHIEEDAGKLIHDAEQGTLIDCNRCGVPLIEIVSEPDIRTPAGGGGLPAKAPGGDRLHGRQRLQDERRLPALRREPFHPQAGPALWHPHGDEEPELLPVRAAGH